MMSFRNPLNNNPYQYLFDLSNNPMSNLTNIQNMKSYALTNPTSFVPPIRQAPLTGFKQPSIQGLTPYNFQNVDLGGKSLNATLDGVSNSAFTNGFNSIGKDPTTIIDTPFKEVPKNTITPGGGGTPPNTPPGGTSSIGDWFNKNIKQTWKPESGWGGKFAKSANIISGIAQGAQAIGGLANNAKTGSTIDSLKGDILNAYGNNPLANSMLTSDQLAQIRRLKKGYKTNEPGADDVFSQIIQDLPSTLLNTGMGAITGGIPGAIIGGVGGLVNSGIKGFGSGQAQQAQELESLYNTLLNAEQQYKGMLMPNSYGLPLRQPYASMYM